MQSPEDGEPSEAAILARLGQDAGVTRVVGLAQRLAEAELKLIKRQMYGRANFDLLRRRVLLAT